MPIVSTQPGEAATGRIGALAVLPVFLELAGKRAVRLKSGDPMLFGRGVEEIEVLEGEGIGYDVVPGITAGLAMAARLGISLTHRDCARSARFVTGHSRSGGVTEDIDWSAVADPSATPVFYMGGHTAVRISAMLMAQGMSGETPVAIAAFGRAGETGCLADLAGWAAAVAKPGSDRPVLIGVGRVFARRAIWKAPAVNAAEGYSWGHSLARVTAARLG